MPGLFIRNYLAEIMNIFETINLKEFSALINELTEAYVRRSHIFICGNGGSGSNASHFSCDINKGVYFEKNQRH